MAFDEEGQAVTAERKVAICAARLQAADRAGRLRARRHHLRPEHPHRRHRHGGAQQLRRRVLRGRPRSSSSCSPRRRPPAASATSRSRFRGNDIGPRGDERRVPLPRDPRRARHGHRQRRPARRSTRRSPRTCSNASRTCCSTAGPTPPSGCRLRRDASRQKGKKERASDLAWRKAPVEERLKHALINGIVDFIDAGRRGGPAEVRPAAARSSKGR